MTATESYLQNCERLANRAFCSLKCFGGTLLDSGMYVEPQQQISVDSSWGRVYTVSHVSLYKATPSETRELHA